jgi:hypothetical protein
MSRQGIVESYLNGEISRRTLVRRLVGAGVALSAATAYANLLRPKWAHASHQECVVVPHYGHYGHERHYECKPGGHNETAPGSGQGGQGGAGGQGAPGGQGGPSTPGRQVSDTTAPTIRHGKLGTLSLASLLLTGRFFVKYTMNEPGEVGIIAILIGIEASDAKRIALGRGRARFRKAGTKRIVVKLTKTGRRRLKKLRRRRRYRIQVVATATDRAGNSRKRRLNLKLR